MRTRGHQVALPELEGMLTRAAARRVRSTPEGRRLAGWRVSRLVAVGAACLAFAGTAMAATGVWNPVVGSESEPATLSETPVPAALTAQLGVLRREQTPRDRSPEVEATLDGGFVPEGVRLDSVRYLAPGANGEATILLSGEHVRFFFASLLLHSDRGDVVVGKVPPEAAGDAAAAEPPQEPVCVARPFPGDEQAVALCFDLSMLMSGEAHASQVDTTTNTGTALGVVPDGVTTVTAEFGSAPPVTVPVADNYWELPLSGAELSDAAGESGVQRTVWRDADGEIVPQQPAG
jgi:hypothetical protein